MADVTGGEVDRGRRRPSLMASLLPYIRTLVSCEAFYLHALFIESDSDYRCVIVAECSEASGCVRLVCMNVRRG